MIQVCLCQNVQNLLDKLVGRLWDYIHYVKVTNSVIYVAIMK